MRGDYYNLPGTCGVRLWARFGEPYTDGMVTSLPLGGAGLACAGFVNTPTCEETYRLLKRKFNIVYQSSVRINRNSGRPFFFVVYDGKRN